MAYFFERFDNRVLKILNLAVLIARLVGGQGKDGNVQELHQSWLRNYIRQIARNILLERMKINYHNKSVSRNVRQHYILFY